MANNSSACNLPISYGPYNIWTFESVRRSDYADVGDNVINLTHVGDFRNYFAIMATRN